MNRETLLKIQSHVDGRLAAAEAAEISQLVARDPDAQAIARELQTTREHLRDFAQHVRVPATRDFYWSQIARRIEAEARSQPDRPLPKPAPILAPWRLLLRWLTPAAIIALFALVFTWPSLPVPGMPSTESTSAPEMLTETSGDDFTSITFRSESQNMTVVWVKNRSN